MKTHIKLSEPEYIINVETREISCYIEAQAQLEIFNFLFFDNVSMYKKLMKKFQMTGYDDFVGFTGVARIKDGDIWDETLGKRIAESKCKRSIYQFYKKVFRFIWQQLMNELCEFDCILDAVWTANNTEEKHFKQLTGVDVNEDKY